MNIKLLVSLLVLIPCVADAAAPRRENARVGVQRVSMAGTRTINASGTSKTQEKTKNTNSNSRSTPIRVHTFALEFSMKTVMIPA